MNSRRLTKILLMYDVYVNAVQLGWEGSFKKNHVVLKKKRSEMTDTDHDLAVLIKKVVLQYR